MAENEIERQFFLSIRISYGLLLTQYKGMQVNDINLQISFERP
jgi:hypothetical protein